jgi:hypothetical protein
LTNEINQLLLDNKDLKKQIEDTRKERLQATQQLEQLKNTSSNLEMRKIDMENRNNEAEIGIY